MKNKNQNLINLNAQTYKKNIMFVDVETIGDITKGEKAFPFDISFVIYDNINDKVLEKGSLIISDIYDNAYLMNSCYYKKNIPFYNEKLKQDKDYKKVSQEQALNKLQELKETYNITLFSAYNADFDYKAINNLSELHKRKSPIKNMVILDLLYISFISVKNSKQYSSFCKTNNFLTESKKNCSTNAETMYKFLSGKKDFEEKHTGLEDLKIELFIFKKLKEHKKTMPLNKKVHLFMYKNITINC